MSSNKYSRKRFKEITADEWLKLPHDDPVYLRGVWEDFDSWTQDFYDFKGFKCIMGDYKNDEDAFEEFKDAVYHHQNIPLDLQLWEYPTL